MIRKNERILFFSLVDYCDKHRIWNPAGGSSLFPKQRKKKKGIPVKQALWGGFFGPGKYVQEGQNSYILRVSQSTKKIREKWNCMIPVLWPPQVMGLGHHMGSHLVLGSGRGLISKECLIAIQIISSLQKIHEKSLPVDRHNPFKVQQGLTDANHHSILKLLGLEATCNSITL